MVEQKTTKEILSTAIKDFDVFPSQKGVLIYVDQELDNQVWLRKDENNPLNYEPKKRWLVFKDWSFRKPKMFLLFNKTKWFIVKNKENDIGLGEIKWDSGWRQYVFDDGKIKLAEGCLFELFEKIRDLRLSSDCSLAPEATTTGERLSPTSGGSKHTKDRNLLSMGLKAETEKCNVIARETPSVSAENIKDEEKKEKVK